VLFRRVRAAKRRRFAAGQADLIAGVKAGAISSLAVEVGTNSAVAALKRFPGRVLVETNQKGWISSRDEIRDEGIDQSGPERLVIDRWADPGLAG
jgi:hypothetical protein